LIVVGFLLFYLIWTYNAFYIKEQLSRFLQNGEKIVFFEPIPGLDQPREFSIETIKQHSGNRMELVKNDYLINSQIHLIDAFKPNQELPLFYGLVTHPVDIAKESYQAD